MIVKLRTRWWLTLALVAWGCAEDEGISEVQSNRPSDREERDASDGEGNDADDDDSWDDDSSDDDSSDDDSSDDDSPDDDTSHEPADDTSDDDDSMDDNSSDDDSDDVVDVPDEPDDDEDDVTFGGGGGPPSVVVGDDDAPADDDDAEPMDPLVSCEGVLGVGDGVLIDDLEDGDLDTLVQDNRAGSWFAYDDSSSGTHSLLVEEVAGGATGSTRAVHVVGGNFSDWGSGFGFGLNWGSEGRCVFDASRYDGVRFWIRSDVETRFFAVHPSVIPIVDGGTCEDSCWDSHGYEIPAQPEWTEVFVPFEEMLQQGWALETGPLDTTSIFTMEFALDPQIEYDVWIDDIGFYVDGEELPSYTTTE